MYIKVSIYLYSYDNMGQTNEVQEIQTKLIFFFFYFTCTYSLFYHTVELFAGCNQ